MRYRNFSLSQILSGIVVPLLVIAWGAAAYFILWPKYEVVKSHRQDLLEKQDVLSEAQAKLTSIQELATKITQKPKDLKLLDEAIPTTPRIPELLGNFDYLAKQSGLLIKNLQLTTAPTLATVKEGEAVSPQVARLQKLLSATDELSVIQIDLTLSGTYPNLKSFLRNVEENLRLLDIEAMVFSEIDEESSSQEYSLRLYTYYQKE